MFEEIVVVVPEDSLDMYRRLIEYKVIVVAGGDTRTASMLNGLSFVNSKCVMVHEGARPFVSVEHIENLKNMFVDCGRLPTITVKPVIDLATLDGNAISRERIQLIEPPMFTRTKDLKSMIQLFKDGVITAISHGRLPTDSVEMAQIASGNGWVRCPLIGINYKLTVFEDLLLAERYFK